MSSDIPPHSFLGGYDASPGILQGLHFGDVASDTNQPLELTGRVPQYRSREKDRKLTAGFRHVSRFYPLIDGLARSWALVRNSLTSCWSVRTEVIDWPWRSSGVYPNNRLVASFTVRTRPSESATIRESVIDLRILDKWISDCRTVSSACLKSACEASKASSISLILVPKVPSSSCPVTTTRSPILPVLTIPATPELSRASGARTICFRISSNTAPKTKPTATTAATK